MIWNPQWKQVTCCKCQTTYTCTVVADYYNSTNDQDGVCEACLIGGLPVISYQVNDDGSVCPL